MKRYFLIDLENVGHTFLDGIEKLTVNDTIIICHNLRFGRDIATTIEARLSQTRAIVKRLYINNREKNAMDFCLCVKLGQLIAENGSSAKYYLISNDKGFDIASDYAKNMTENIHIKRVESLKVEFTEEQSREKTKEQLTEILSTYNKKVVNITRNCLAEAKNREEFHNLLQKRLQERHCREIYQKTKSLIVA